MSDPKNQGRMLYLPDEIWLVIFSHLDYTTAVVLTSAHVRFWSHVEPATYYSPSQIYSDLEYALRASQRFRGWVACDGCFRRTSRAHPATEGAVGNIGFE